MDQESLRMPVRYLTDGTIAVDTIEEAVTYERLKASQSQVRKKKPRRDSRLAGPNGTWEAFLATLTTMPSRKILALVKGRGETGITLSELQAALRDPIPQKTNGQLVGLTMKARSVGVDPGDIILRGSDNLYRPGRLLRDHDPPVP